LLLDKNRHNFRFKQILYSGIGMACLILPIAVLAYIDVPEGLSGIPWPTFSTVKSLVRLLTGRQGEGLLAFYLLFGCIGLSWGVGFGCQRDLITRWKFTLMASCLFVPVLTMLIISFFIAPIFTPKYALYVLPYLAVITATGIVVLARRGWEMKKYRYICVPIGIAVLVLFALLSTIGIRSYYDDYQKTDWRKATQFLETRCSESLRLYYAPYVDLGVLRYNSSLGSQEAKWWNNFLKNNPDSNEIAASLPDKYEQVCLVLSYPGNLPKELQAGIQKKFRNVSTVKFYEVQIDVYRRQ